MELGEFIFTACETISFRNGPDVFCQTGYFEKFPQVAVRFSEYRPNQHFADPLPMPSVAIYDGEKAIDKSPKDETKRFKHTIQYVLETYLNEIYNRSRVPLQTHDDDFPILFEDSRIKVYQNGSGEIFVENKRNKKATVRISSDGGSYLRITAHDGTMTPGSINGLSAIYVLPGKVKID